MDRSGLVRVAKGWHPCYQRYYNSTTNNNLLDSKIKHTHIQSTPNRFSDWQMDYATNPSKIQHKDERSLRALGENVQWHVAMKFKDRNRFSR